MTARKLLFLLGFLLLPLLAWTMGVSPALARRHVAISELDSAHLVQQTNATYPEKRDRLLAAWNDFRPMADERIQNLHDDLNPVLIAKRVYDLAASRDCILTVKPQESSDPDPKYKRYNVNGQGPYTNVLQLVTDLERGNFRIRFDQLQLTLTTVSTAADPQVNMTASFLIPNIPIGSEGSQDAPSAGAGRGGVN